MIDKMMVIMKNSKRRTTNLNVAWIDYTKAYNMVPHTWVLQCLKIFKVANNISSVIKNSMKNWKVKLATGKETLGEVKIEAFFKDTLYHRSCLSSL